MTSPFVNQVWCSSAVTESGYIYDPLVLAWLYQVNSKYSAHKSTSMLTTNQFKNHRRSVQCTQYKLYKRQSFYSMDSYSFRYHRIKRSANSKLLYQMPTAEKLPSSDVKPCSLVHGYQSFREIDCPQLLCNSDIKYQSPLLNRIINQQRPASQHRN